jgi:dUTP pyrophosphatase
MEVKIQLLHPGAKIPIKATSGSVCYDIFSPGFCKLDPNIACKVRTGLSFELPEGVGLEIRPRSGLSLKGIIILNSPGTLDSDYRGELSILMMNLGKESYFIEPGDRICQVRGMAPLSLAFEAVDILTETERGQGGLGSTGR